MLALHWRLAGYYYIGAGLAVAVQGSAACAAADLNGLFFKGDRRARYGWRCAFFRCLRGRVVKLVHGLRVVPPVC